MRIFLYILIGISTLISCSGSPDPLYPRYTTFPDEKIVATQEISIDSAFFRYPYRVAVKDSIAVIMDLHNDSHYFYAFTYPEWKPIAPFGKRGEGPGEMLSAEMFQFSALDSVWTLDANRMLITRWSVSPTGKTVLRKEEIRLDKTLVRSLDFYRTDSAFLITDYLGDFRYHKVSHSGKPIKNIGKIPTEISYEQDIHPALAQAWRSFTDYNPKNGIYAMATQLGEALEIYNLKTQTHNVIYGPAGEPQFIAKGGEDSRPASKGLWTYKSQTIIFIPFSMGCPGKSGTNFTNAACLLPKEAISFTCSIWQETRFENIRSTKISWASISMKKQTSELRPARKAIIRS